MTGLVDARRDSSTTAGADNEVVQAATGRSVRWRDLAPAPMAGPTAAFVPSGTAALGWVVAHAATGAELLLAHESRATDELRTTLLDEGFTVVSGSDPVRRPRRTSEAGRLWLLTSGTTGRPKRVGHTLASLSTVASPPAPLRWLCPYTPGSYAWWQLVTLSLTHPGQDLVVLDPSAPGSWARAAVAHRVTAVSGTPTFFRRALLDSAADLARLPLLQVTLGGEPVDQAILDALRGLFPQARISWIYASSELGASIVVHDGRAGFPRSWVGRDVPGRPLIEVEGEELVLRSPHHAAGLEGAVRTGDRVRVEHDRVHVVGRLDSDEINVGGTKVSAAGVREVLLGHPEVQWARAFGRTAPLVGSVVAAEVVLVPDAALARTDPADELRRWCADRLADAAVPRRVRVLDTIPVKESWKSDVR